MTTEKSIIYIVERKFSNNIWEKLGVYNHLENAKLEILEHFDEDYDTINLNGTFRILKEVIKDSNVV